VSDAGVPLAAGEATAVAPGVQRVLAPNPGIMTGPGTNTYVVGDLEEVVVIDPGPDDDSHRDAVVAAIGARRVSAVLATHHHPDHWPLARRLCVDTAAPLLAHGLPGVLDPDEVVLDGHEVAAGAVRMRAVHTPGHTSDHLCWYLEEQRILFTGDHVMSGSTVVIAPPEGNMATYLVSLERTREMAPTLLMPAHGSVIDQPDTVFGDYLTHRRERERQVLHALEPTGSTVAEIVAAVYVDVAEVLHPVARYSVLAHLLKLEGERRVERAEPASAPDRARGQNVRANPELPSAEPSGMQAKWRIADR